MPPRTRSKPPPTPKPAPPAGDLLNDRAYLAIRDAIASFRLAPGQSVSVGSLADWLQMSRTPIRDALQRLQHDGLVRSLPRRGLVVAQLTAEQAQDLYELQEALESMAARLAAERATPEQRKAIVDVARRMGATAQDPAAWMELDTAYHTLLLAAAGSRAITRAADALAPQLLRFRGLAALNRRDRPGRSAKEHLQIAQAIARSDPDTALRLTHAHWTAVRAEAVENLQLYAQMGGLIGADQRLALPPARAGGEAV